MRSRQNFLLLDDKEKTDKDGRSPGNTGAVKAGAGELQLASHT